MTAESSRPRPPGKPGNGAPPEPETPAVSVFRPGLAFPAVYPVDPSGGRVPAGLEPWVRVRPDVIGFTRRSTSTLRAAGPGALAAAAVVVGAGTAWLALALGTGLELALLFLGLLPVVAVVAALLPLFSWIALGSRAEWVVATRRRVGGSDGFTWSEDDHLELSGDPAKHRIQLHRVDARGDRALIRSWDQVQLHRSRGFDLGTIRWFAAQLAALAGVPLRETLPDDAVWHRAYQGRVAAHQVRRMKMPRRYRRLLEAEPHWPTEAWGSDGVVLTVSGSGVALLPELGVSHDRTQPIRVGPDGVTIEGRTLPLARIQEIQPWFGDARVSDGLGGLGQVVALTTTGTTLLIQRRLGTVKPGVVLGAAAALTHAIDVVRRATPAVPLGTDADIPDALRALTARDDRTLP